jgi:ABC-type lipoprotein export system ATPase subunit
VTLRLHDASLTVAGRELLEPTSMTVAPGELLAVVGASGTGKTSVLSVLAGLVPATTGTVTLDEVDVLTVDRRRIGVVTQPVVLASSLTVEENISLPLQAGKRPPADVVTATEAVLHRLNLDGLASRMPARLSGGQRQRVATARAVVGGPALVVADEPTSELDEDSRGRVVDVLRATAAAGAIVVVATHDAEVAAVCTLTLPLGQRQPA